MAPASWQLLATHDIPESFLAVVRQHTRGQGDRLLAQLLWQWGYRDKEQLPGFLDPDYYTPTTPFAFGQEMKRAIARIAQAHQQHEKVAIWGDCAPDGIAATAVLWDGLGPFFRQESQLTYYIPNRFTESHGLNRPGLETLRHWGASVIITADNGSSNAVEIMEAQTLGMDVIIIDHHTLPDSRPPAIAQLNPRYFAPTHPLYHLSGVAVAYKLMEALYETYPTVPHAPLEQLLDLVALGLLADYVTLEGDCRYLAQCGIRQLAGKTMVRPGIKHLLEYCKKSGDRPTDIAFGIGQRIRAVSHMHGDASACVELLTSRNPRRCGFLAQQTELANTRLKAIQQKVFLQAKAQLDTLDLSTTAVVILRNSQWEMGVLGLVARDIAKVCDRPTILLTYDRHQSLWKGSACSAKNSSLHALLDSQAQLLHHYGGHPAAIDLSICTDNLSFFVANLHRQGRQLLGTTQTSQTSQTEINLSVTVSQLGEELFRELQWLEPLGMGNRTPNLLVRNCGLKVESFANVRDIFNKTVRYLKIDISLWDDSGEIQGICWGISPDVLPQGEGFDAIVTLLCRFVDNLPCYGIELQAIAPSSALTTELTSPNFLDLRESSQHSFDGKNAILCDQCPTTWADLRPAYQQAIAQDCPLALAYQMPDALTPETQFKTLVGIAKYYYQQQSSVEVAQLQANLQWGDRLLELGLAALVNVGIRATHHEGNIIFRAVDPDCHLDLWDQFQQVAQELQFQQQYFAHSPISLIESTLAHLDEGQWLPQ